MPSASYRSSKKHTTRLGRVVYDRKTHVMRLRDRVRILRRADYHGETVEAMLKAAADILAEEVRLLRTAQSYYFSSPADFSAILVQFQELLSALVYVAQVLGTSYWENFLNIVSRVTGLKKPGG